MTPFRPAMRTPFSPLPARLRRAFTLLELLLALALTAVLMAGLYSGLEIYRRLTLAGQQDVQRAQLARALLRAIRRDLMSVVHQSPAGVPADDELFFDPAGESAGLSAASFFGTPETLVLQISRPGPPPGTAAYQSGSTGVFSDLHSVSWILAVPNAGGLQGAVGNLAAGGSTLLSRDTDVQGLARLEGDWRELDALDQAGDLRGLAARAELLADEVRALQFRYFDGQTWLEEWNSNEIETLPRAVEILIGFAAPETGPTIVPGTVRPQESESEVYETYRLVVALPAHGSGQLP